MERFEGAITFTGKGVRDKICSYDRIRSGDDRKRLRGRGPLHRVTSYYLF